MPLRVRNVEAGFVDATGFHPLRSSRDYDPDRAGDDYGERPKRKVAKRKKAKGKVSKGKRNPIPKGIPKGKFVKARFNRDGTVSVVVPSKRNPRNKSAYYITTEGTRFNRVYAIRLSSSGGVITRVRGTRKDAQKVKKQIEGGVW